jgi:hypothetical protein
MQTNSIRIRFEILGGDTENNETLPIQPSVTLLYHSTSNIQEITTAINKHFKCRESNFYLDEGKTLVCQGTLDGALRDLMQNLCTENAVKLGFKDKQTSIHDGIVPVFVRPDMNGVKKREPTALMLEQQRMRAPKLEDAWLNAKKIETIKRLMPRDSNGLYCLDFNSSNPHFWGWGFIQCLGEVYELLKLDNPHLTMASVRKGIKE